MLGVLGVAGGVAVVSSATPASAALVWGHPFTFRSGYSRGLQYNSQGALTHEGADYTPGAGTEIRAVADGTVIFSSSSWGTGGAYGEGVIVDHGGGWTSRYAHMQVGTRVTGGYVPRGTYLGRVGNTGRSYGAHLHLEIRLNGSVRDALAMTLNAPLAGSSAIPPQPEPEPEPEPLILEDPMIRISAPNRGVALIGPGYYRHLNSNEEVEQSGAIITKDLSGNDRQFDLWVSMAFAGASAPAPASA